MVARVAAVDRATGAAVKKASDELDRGTLSAESYGLNVKNILTAQETASLKVSADGQLVLSETEAKVDLHRNGEVLEQMWRVGKKLLAAGIGEETLKALEKMKSYLRCIHISDKSEVLSASV